MNQIKEPPWLSSKVDQRFALLRHRVDTDEVDADTLVMVMLTEPPEGSSLLTKARWERSCDNCGTYCPPQESADESTNFYVGHCVRRLYGAPVAFVFGTCARCRGAS